MKIRIALVAIAALSLAGIWATTALSEGTVKSTPQPHHAAHAPPKLVPMGCRIETFREFSQAVWAHSRWRRGQPPASILNEQVRRLACAPPAHRHAMKHTWSFDKTSYYAYRKNKLMWIGCPDHIRMASLAHDVDAGLLYGIEGAESTWGTGGSNRFGLLYWGGDTSDPYASAMEASRLLDELVGVEGSWEGAMLHYSGGGYGLSHPLSLNAGTCPNNVL